MPRPARLARALMALSTAVVGLVLVSPAAEAAGGVGPGQAFVASVNGSFSAATVTVICPGPTFLGRRGHPASGQQLELLSPPPPVAFGTKVSVGLTGTEGQSIVARFSDDPSVVTTFHQYFVTKAIPTSLLLPCDGTGKVVFRPVPGSPTARPSVVHITYLNPAV